MVLASLKVEELRNVKGIKKAIARLRALGKQVAQALAAPGLDRPAYAPVPVRANAPVRRVRRG